MVTFVYIKRPCIYRILIRFILLRMAFYYYKIKIMKKSLTISAFIFCVIFLFPFLSIAQTATLTINSDIHYQKITGFGGFVNSPQFAYGHMTTAQIRQLWGKNSEMGYNIMRLYLPIGESNWPQALSTAKLAQELGLIIFASPWSMPAEWKTNNSTAGVVIRNGVEDIGYLKVEHYEDYAHYLNKFVLYLRNNGVELAGISLQNEPDYKVSYAGCLWTPQQMAGFIRDFGHIISCPIIAAEGVGITDNYANAFLPDDVFNKLGIFGGHQYGQIQTAHKKLQEKGMEVWMTEFLINWNANQTTERSFNWSIDAFDFAKAVNTALLKDINAWVHYASRRYYGMMGDGLHGTQNGVITKRGYILSHYAKYTTGTIRIHNAWKDGTTVLDGSAYLSVSGDSIIVKVINPSNTAYQLTVDLPFLTQWGKSITTTSGANMVEAPVNIDLETFRPKVSIAASSFTTLIFRKGAERPSSEMVGMPVFYNKIEDQKITNPSFGTQYQMSGKTFIFDNSRHLISSQTTSSNGYLELDDRYNKMVFHIKSITSPATYTSANTTLYYVNDNGAVRSHNYGTISFSPNGNFNWVLDISPQVLPEGCKGIIGLRNGNYSSVLTITFGDVYFLRGDEKAYKFSGPYSIGDSNLLDALEDMAITSIDFTQTNGIPSGIDWHAYAANKNSIYYLGDDMINDNTNVITGTSAQELSLSDMGGSFYVPHIFTATTASYTRTFNGYGVMVLPFEATIPEGARAYRLQYLSDQVIGTGIVDNIIPAHTPVLIVGSGTFSFNGSGEVSTPKALSVEKMNVVYVSEKAPAGSYIIKTVGGITTFHRVIKGSEPMVMPFSAYFDIAPETTAATLPLVLDGVISNINNLVPSQSDDGPIYDLLGRRVYHPQKGVIYIRNGKKIVFQ
jgi:glucuronoarabinoxylan endo-1,4-beta-xylanase